MLPAPEMQIKHYSSVVSPLYSELATDTHSLRHQVCVCVRVCVCACACVCVCVRVCVKVWKISRCWCVATTRLSSATRRPHSTTRPETSRSGIIAARHQRVLSAKKSHQQSADDAGQIRPTTAAVRRPMTAWTRPYTAAVRSGSLTPALASSSMDSVTFESERSRAQALAERQSPVTSALSPVVSRTASITTILKTDDDDDDYQQVSNSATTYITGSTVALHCCKVHERINRKTGNSTSCKIVTPENFSSKVCTRDYVGDGNYCAHLCEKRFSGGFSPNR